MDVINLYWKFKIKIYNDVTKGGNPTWNGVRKRGGKQKEDALVD